MQIVGVELLASYKFGSWFGAMGMGLSLHDLRAYNCTKRNRSWRYWCM